MAFKDPDAQRAFQREWMNRRRAAWLAGQRCRCGQPAEHVVRVTPGARKIPWGATPAVRDRVIAAHYEPVCGQHATPKQRADRAAQRPPRSGPPQPRAQESPAGDSALAEEPETPGPFDAAARRRWRQERRARLGYGIPDSTDHEDNDDDDNT